MESSKRAEAGAGAAEGHKYDPTTEEPLDSLNMRPNAEILAKITEWRNENRESQVYIIRPKLTSDKEADVEAGLLDIFRLCEEGPGMRLWLSEQGIIPTVVDILKSSSRNLRRKCLATLCNIANNTDENRVGVAAPEHPRGSPRMASPTETDPLLVVGPTGDDCGCRCDPAGSAVPCP